MNKKIGFLCILGLFSGCAPDSDLVDLLTPSATIDLIFPEHLSECTEGTSLSETESELTFLWEAINNVPAYTLHLTNLRTEDSEVFESSTNSLDVTLFKGTPYAWYVTSVSNPDKVRSETSIFYNAGPGQESFVPFPATAVSPVSGASISVTSTTVNLNWDADDPDDDIVGYDLYFGETMEPEILAENITDDRYLDIPVAAGTTYYWKVVTKDSAGHASASPVFVFTVG